MSTAVSNHVNYLRTLLFTTLLCAAAAFAHPYPTPGSLKVPDERLDGSQEVETHGFYFDRESTLFDCVVPVELSEDSGMCFDTNSTKSRFAWSVSQAEYGKKNGLDPVTRFSVGPSAILDVPLPFSQYTTYVYYVAPSKVVMCRSTFT
jgi:hypothetical protein